MNKQLKLFKVEPLISPELKDLIHGNGTFETALQVAKEQDTNKLALFVECIKRQFKGYYDLDWWLNSPYANKSIFEFSSTKNLTLPSRRILKR